MHSLAIKRGNRLQILQILEGHKTKEGEEFKVIQEDITENNGMKFREGVLTLNIEQFCCH